MLALKTKNIDFAESLLDKSDGSDLFLPNIDGVTPHTYITTQKPLLKHDRLDLKNTFNSANIKTSYLITELLILLPSNLEVATSKRLYFTGLLTSYASQVPGHQYFMPKRVKVYKSYVPARKKAKNSPEIQKIP